jgi:hypothetical protein
MTTCYDINHNDNSMSLKHFAFLHMILPSIRLNMNIEWRNWFKLLYIITITGLITRVTLVKQGILKMSVSESFLVESERFILPQSKTLIYVMAICTEILLILSLLFIHFVAEITNNMKLISYPGFLYDHFCIESLHLS